MGLKPVLLAFERRYEEAAKPFEWKFTRADLEGHEASRRRERSGQGGVRPGFVSELPDQST
jgi:hypothetical protein